MAILPNIDGLELQAGEMITGGWMADRDFKSGPKRGMLVLTNQRLAFQPQDFGIAIKALALLSGNWHSSADPWSLPLSDVTKVEDDAPSKRFPEDGKAMRLTLKNGDVLSF